MVDALDLGSSARKGVGVRVPPCVHLRWVTNSIVNIDLSPYFFCLSSVGVTKPGCYHFNIRRIYDGKRIKYKISNYNV